MGKKGSDSAIEDCITRVLVGNGWHFQIGKGEESKQRCGKNVGNRDIARDVCSTPRLETTRVRLQNPKLQPERCPDLQLRNSTCHRGGNHGDMSLDLTL